MSGENIKYAKDLKCSCGEDAIIFVGLNDPDGTDYPKCRKCADEWRIRLIMELSRDKKWNPTSTNGF